MGKVVQSKCLENKNKPSSRDNKSTDLNTCKQILYKTGNKNASEFARWAYVLRNRGQPFSPQVLMRQLWASISCCTSGGFYCSFFIHGQQGMESELTSPWTSMAGNVREVLPFSSTGNAELQMVSIPDTETAKDQEHKSTTVRAVMTLSLTLMLRSSHLSKRRYSLLSCSQGDPRLQRALPDTWDFSVTLTSPNVSYE